MEKTLGYTVEELTSKEFVNFVHPDDLQPTQGAVESQKEQKEVNNFINRYRKKDGTYRWFEWNSIPQGEILYAAARDITGSRLQEEKLTRINRTYSMLSHVNEMIVREEEKQMIYDNICKIAVEDGHFLLAWIGEVDEKTKRVIPVSKYGNKMEYLDNIVITVDEEPTSKGPTGRSIKEQRAVYCNDIEHGDVMQPWKEKALKMGFKSSASFPIIIDKKVVSCFTVYSEDGKFFDHDELRLLGDLSADIAFSLAYIDKEKERLESSLYSRSLIEASLDPLVTISKKGKITDVNQATIDITGVSREELIGTYFSSYFTEPEKAQEGYQKVFEEGKVTDYPLTIKGKEGKFVDVLYNAITYKDSEGKVSGVFAAARDITELKKMEEDLKQYVMELERSNKELEQFAYVASHDLKEPLRMVSSYTQLLAERYKDTLDRMRMIS